MALNDNPALEDQSGLQRQIIMTIKPSFSLAALRWLCAPAAACALLIGGTAPSLAQFGTTTCTFKTSELGKLPTQVEAALKLQKGTAQIPIIIIPTFNMDLGQPPTPSGITLCTNADNVSSVSPPTTEAMQFPSGPANIQEIQQTSYVLVNGNLMRICQSDQQTGCVVITKK